MAMGLLETKPVDVYFELSAVCGVTCPGQYPRSRIRPSARPVTAGQVPGPRALGGLLVVKRAVDVGSLTD